MSSGSERRDKRRDDARRQLPGRSGEASGAASPPAGPDVVYREQLRTPPWWYLVALAVAAIIAAEFHVGGHTLITDWIPWCTLLPLSVIGVWSLGRARLEISGGEIRIRGAHLPLRYVSGVVALDAGTLRRVVGREGDPAAFVSIRSWVGPGVQLWLDDPDDPAPYWVLSTRNPQRVVELVRAGGR